MSTTDRPLYSDHDKERDKGDRKTLPKSQRSRFLPLDTRDNASSVPERGPLVRRLNNYWKDHVKVQNVTEYLKEHLSKDDLSGAKLLELRSRSANLHGKHIVEAVSDFTKAQIEALQREGFQIPGETIDAFNHCEQKALDRDNGNTKDRNEALDNLLRISKSVNTKLEAAKYLRELYLRRQALCRGYLSEVW